MIRCILNDINGSTKAEFCGEFVDRTFDGFYREGDIFKVKSDSDFIAASFDESQVCSIIYLPKKEFSFHVPIGGSEEAYDRESWERGTHRIFLREIDEEEACRMRNIALNSIDIPDNDSAFPHAHANFVTRGETVFWARNAIDGVCDNSSHGSYPYHSWAGGAREDLVYTLDFGREVEVNELVFYLRADFPHDTYWKSLNIIFSDGEKVPVSFEMTADGQHAVLEEPKKTTTITLCDFKQASTPLSWAALSQLEVIGKYIKKEIKTMEVRQASNAKDVKHYTTDRLREEFHISNLFTKDNVRMVYSHIDRIITAGLMPVFQPLKLEAGKELAAEYFLERREMGCINIGGRGTVTVDGTDYVMEPRDGIYIGMGNKEISFTSEDPENPAKFYVSSCPAHKSYPIVKIDISKAKKVPCGSAADANKRIINQYIHPEVMQSCQLAMGLTQLEEGSVWNTMPCHTHDRRMEVYLYLDMGEDDVVFHMMGEPNETRHIVMHNEEAVISPSWSIHSGVGTKAYSFIWAMCGENQEFTDMDAVATKDLR
jgi:4-deoxy-L-threo-5-hexosulose-uronate ketol-isomerase